eukprot:5926530-Prymnesium_polylepis.1
MRGTLLWSQGFDWHTHSVSIWLSPSGALSYSAAAAAAASSSPSSSSSSAAPAAAESCAATALARPETVRLVWASHGCTYMHLGPLKHPSASCHGTLALEAELRRLLQLGIGPSSWVKPQTTPCLKYLQMPFL